MEPLTYLFVPGDRPERFDKAAAAGAGAVILDLEDAVLPDAKARAREAIAEWTRRHPEHAARVVVRINDRQSPYWDHDLALVASAGIETVMLPKAESHAQVTEARASARRVIALIETARGVQRVDDIAGAPGVVRLAFGTIDYAVDLDIAGDEAALVYPASRIVLASRCAGLPAPIAGVTPAIDDAARLRADVAWERSLGFGAKLAIHPRQLPVIDDALRPSDADVAWARRVLAAAEGAPGAVQVDGRMIDRPVIRKAQSILARIATR